MPKQWRWRMAQRWAMNLAFHLSPRPCLCLAVAIEFAGRWPWPSGHRAAPWILCGWLSPSWVWFLLLPLAEWQHADPLGVPPVGAAVFWALYIVFGNGRAPACRAVGVAGLLVAALVVVPVGVAHAGAALLSPPACRWGGRGGHLQRAAHLAGDDGPGSACSKRPSAS